MTTLRCNPVAYGIAGRGNTSGFGSGLYDYILAGNGLFLEAKRPELKTRMPISACEVRGLPQLAPYCYLQTDKVSREVMEAILFHAQEAARDGLEQLYHLCWDGQTVRLEIPPQTQTAVSCKPLDDSLESSLARAIIEIHSHHSMTARFSAVDDADERGYRIYGVIGRVLDAPEIRFRVGVYGYFWEIPACWVCEDLPEDLEDCHD